MKHLIDRVLELQDGEESPAAPVVTETDPELKTLLKSLVRSQVEYCSMLWSPREQHLINLLESVQADFTRKISKYQQYDDVLGMPVCSKSYTLSD